VTIADDSASSSVVASASRVLRYIVYVSREEGAATTTEIFVRIFWNVGFDHSS